MLKNYVRFHQSSHLGLNHLIALHNRSHAFSIVGDDIIRIDTPVPYAALMRRERFEESAGDPVRLMSWNVGRRSEPETVSSDLRGLAGDDGRWGIRLAPRAASKGASGSKRCGGAPEAPGTGPAAAGFYYLQWTLPLARPAPRRGGLLRGQSGSTEVTTATANATATTRAISTAKARRVLASRMSMGPWTRRGWSRPTLGRYLGSRLRAGHGTSRPTTRQ